jgi:hypothetical protein
VPVSQVAFEIQKELIMDVVENGAYALARYEAEVTGHCRDDVRSTLRDRNVNIWGEY